MSGIVSKVYSCSDDDFKKIVAQSVSFNNCLKRLGYASHGNQNMFLLKQRINELKLSTEHFTRGGSGGYIPPKPLNEVLVENSTYRSSNNLKRRLLREGLLENKCALCGNKGIWNGRPLVLQLDHINGNHFDNRLENLRILCPNCHSQTDTFCTRKSRTKPDESL